MPTSEPMKRGQCPACLFRNVPVRKNGTMRVHNLLAGDTPSFREVCAGSGHPQMSGDNNRHGFTGQNFSIGDRNLRLNGEIV